MVFFIIGIVFAAVTQLLSFNLWLAGHSQDRTLALTIMQNRLEHLRVAPFAGIDAYAEERVPVNTEGIPNAAGPFYRSTFFGPILNHTRAITVIVEREGQLRRPGIELTLNSRLLDPAIFKVDEI